MISNIDLLRHYIRPSDFKIFVNLTSDTNLIRR
jgi:hypothetical protein